MKNYIGEDSVLKNEASPLVFIYESLILWKKRAEKGRRIGSFRSIFVRGFIRAQPSAAPVETLCGKPVRSAKTLKEIADQDVEISISSAEVLDLSNRVDNG